SGAGPSQLHPFRNANWLYFKIPDDVDVNSITPQDFFDGLDLIYFRTKVQYDWKSGFDTGMDHVSDYAQFDPSSIQFVHDGQSGSHYAVVKLKDISLDEDGGPTVNPIYRAAIEHARLNYPEPLYAPQGFSNDDNAASLTLDVLSS